jgi:uncharacterized membrane protein (DUF485 family)
LLKKTSLGNYFTNLRISFHFSEYKNDFLQARTYEKVLISGMLISVIWFFVNSFVFTTHFPTYADDSFSNRNKPILNILHDGGVKLFGPREEILARGRLGYPIHIAIYKTVIAKFQ